MPLKDIKLNFYESFTLNQKPFEIHSNKFKNDPAETQLIKILIL